MKRGYKRKEKKRKKKKKKKKKREKTRKPHQKKISLNHTSLIMIKHFKFVVDRLENKFGQTV
jgi:hypothetical protein